MAIVSRVIIITLLASILGVLTVTLVVPMVQAKRDEARMDAAIQSVIDEGTKRGY